MQTDVAESLDEFQHGSSLIAPVASRTSRFAPAGRDSAEELGRRRAIVRNTPLLQAMIDAMPSPVLILNHNRQIVGANQTLLEALGTTLDAALGKRPGELTGCSHALEGPDGCGTGIYCTICGAVAAILESQTTRGQVSREVRLSLQTPSGPAAMDLRVTASDLDLQGEHFTVCALEDIADRKRLAVLARAFFHDVLNTAGGIRGYAQFLADEMGADWPHADCFARLTRLAEELVEELQSHRDLACAESGDLLVEPRRVRTRSLLENLQTLYAKHTAGLDRKILLQDVWDGEVVTDGPLLARVLGNMVKNALEATEPGGTVKVRCSDAGPAVRFSVWNAAVMPEDVQLQVFGRSFSTKAEAGRGIGTHAMKLLGERYLGGQVAFTSREGEGTTFTLVLPKVMPTA